MGGQNSGRRAPSIEEISAKHSALAVELYEKFNEDGLIDRTEREILELHHEEMELLETKCIAERVAVKTLLYCAGVERVEVPFGLTSEAAGAVTQAASGSETYC